MTPLINEILDITKEATDRIIEQRKKAREERIAKLRSDLAKEKEYVRTLIWTEVVEGIRDAANVGNYEFTYKLISNASRNDLDVCRMRIDAIAEIGRDHGFQTLASIAYNDNKRYDYTVHFVWEEQHRQ